MVFFTMPSTLIRPFLVFSICRRTLATLQVSSVKPVYLDLHETSLFNGSPSKLHQELALLSKFLHVARYNSVRDSQVFKRECLHDSYSAKKSKPAGCHLDVRSFSSIKAPTELNKLFSYELFKQGTAQFKPYEAAAVHELITSVVRSTQLRSELGYSAIKHMAAFLFRRNDGATLNMLLKMLIESHNKEPMANVLNYMLWWALKKADKDGYGLASRLLAGFTSLKVHPNDSTWYIMFTTAISNGIKLQLLDEMAKERVPMTPLFSQAVELKAEQLGDFDEALKWTKTVGHADVRSTNYNMRLGLLPTYLETGDFEHAMKFLGLNPGLFYEQFIEIVLDHFANRKDTRNYVSALDLFYDLNLINKNYIYNATASSLRAEANTNSRWSSPNGTPSKEVIALNNRVCEDFAAVLTETCGFEPVADNSTLYMRFMYSKAEEQRCIDLHNYLSPDENIAILFANGFHYGKHFRTQVLDYVNSFPLEDLAVLSRKMIFRFYTRTLRFQFIENMIHSKLISVTIDDFNWVFWTASVSIKVTARFLRLMHAHGIAPNSSTWYILVTKINNPLIASRIVDMMVERNVDIYPVLGKAIDKKYQHLGNMAGVLDWMVKKKVYSLKEIPPSHRYNIMRRFLWEGKLLEVFEFMSSSYTPLSVSMLKQMIDHCMETDKYMEIYVVLRLFKTKQGIDYDRVWELMSYLEERRDPVADFIVSKIRELLQTNSFYTQERPAMLNENVLFEEELENKWSSYSAAADGQIGEKELAEYFVKTAKDITTSNNSDMFSQLSGISVVREKLFEQSDSDETNKLNKSLFDALKSNDLNYAFCFILDFKYSKIPMSWSTWYILLSYLKDRNKSVLLDAMDSLGIDYDGVV